MLRLFRWRIGTEGSISSEFHIHLIIFVHIYFSCFVLYCKVHSIIVMATCTVVTAAVIKYI